MGASTPHAPVLSLVVAFSRHAPALEWAQQHVTAAWGPVALTSPRFEFVETDYYGQSMGTQLQLEIWALEQLMPPEVLADRKLQTNDWESTYADLGLHGEVRPLNLDPGYLTPAKFVLASTKDHAHRLYLGRGIYAEVTLYYTAGHWQAREWTYPNYRRDDYQRFLSTCRERLRLRQRKGADA